MAEKLIAEASKKAQGSTSTLGRIFGGGAKLDEAQSLYEKAANKFKMNDEWTKAAEAFASAADCAARQGEKYDEASNYCKAGDAERKEDPAKAQVWLEKAACVFNELGKFHQSAKLFKDMAEDFEKQKDYEMAMQNYELAAKYFNMDQHGKSSHATMMEKWANLASLYSSDKSNKCIQVYRDLAHTALSNDLRKFGAKQLFFRAFLLELATKDSITADNSLNEFFQADYRFSGSPEGNLCEAMVKHVEALDLDELDTLLQNHTNVYKLDRWHNLIIGQIRNKMEQEGARPAKLNNETKQMLSKIGEGAKAADDSDDLL